MSILSYVLIGFGILILLVIFSILFLLLHFVFKNNSKREVLLDELSSKVREAFYEEKRSSKTLFKNSDWNNIEGAFKYKEPTALIQFYNNEVLTRNFNFLVVDNKNNKQKKWFINNFVPLVNAINNENLTFAEDGMGNSYLIKLQANINNDYSVFFYDHETEEISIIADSLKEFLNSKKFVIV